jgi:GR25 family glycosyltransferase involved in LPS biosynthesis
MNCYCISFEHSAELWPLVKADFARLAPSTWALERILALGARETQRRRISGALDPKEKARFLSHIDLLSEAPVDAPFAIFEDDVLLGANSCLTIDNSISYLNRGFEWDVLYLDLCLNQIGPMADMAVLRRQLLSAGRTRLLDPKGVNFSSATAYIVHPRGVSKILAASREQAEFDVPYDLFLRNLVNGGQLNARYIFPFATSLREKQSTSEIVSDEARAERVLSIYRRMAWRDSSVEQLLPQLAEISKDLDVESKAFAILWAAMADPSFRPR